jgi:hypothetical protein
MKVAVSATWVLVGVDEASRSVRAGSGMIAATTTLYMSERATVGPNHHAPEEGTQVADPRVPEIPPRVANEWLVVYCRQCLGTPTALTHYHNRPSALAFQQQHFMESRHYMLVGPDEDFLMSCGCSIGRVRGEGVDDADAFLATHATHAGCDLVPGLWTPLDRCWFCRKMFRPGQPTKWLHDPQDAVGLPLPLLAHPACETEWLNRPPLDSEVADEAIDWSLGRSPDDDDADRL